MPDKIEKSLEKFCPCRSQKKAEGAGSPQNDPSPCDLCRRRHTHKRHKLFLVPSHSGGFRPETRKCMPPPAVWNVFLSISVSSSFIISKIRRIPCSNNSLLAPPAAAYLSNAFAS